MLYIYAHISARALTHTHTYIDKCVKKIHRTWKTATCAINTCTQVMNEVGGTGAAAAHTQTHTEDISNIVGSKKREESLRSLTKEHIKS